MQSLNNCFHLYVLINLVNIKIVVCNNTFTINAGIKAAVSSSSMQQKAAIKPATQKSASSDSDGETVAVHEVVTVGGTADSDSDSDDQEKQSFASSAGAKQGKAARLLDFSTDQIVGSPKASSQAQFNTGSLSSLVIS